MYAEGFRACVVIQLEGIEVVRHVADPQVLSIARFYPSENDSANPNLIGRQLESGSCSPHDLCQLRLLPRKGLSLSGQLFNNRMTLRVSIFWLSRCNNCIKEEV